MARVAQVDVSKLLDKAREAAERRNYDYALEIYMNILRLDPDNAQARRELRMVELRLAKERGIGLLAKLRAMMRITKASGLHSAKKYEAAMEAAEEALRSDPTSIGALMALGRSALQAGHRNAAAATFEDIRTAKAGGKNKLLLEASRNLAFLCETLGRIDQAKEVWADVKRLNSADPDADSHLRDLYAREITSRIETGISSGGKGSIARQILRSSEDTEKLSRQDMDLRTQDDVLRAIEDAKRDVTARPDDARVYGKLGDLQRRAENYLEAKRAYEEARSRESTNPHWGFKLDDLEIWKNTREVNQLVRKINAGEAALRPEYEKRRAEVLNFRLKSFLEREKQYSTDGRIRFELGSIYFDLAEQTRDRSLYDQAIMRFQIIYTDPNYRHEAGLRMGIGFARKGQYDLALKRLEETLASLEIKDLRWKNLMYARAETLELADRKPEALQAFFQIYELDVAFKDVSKRVEALQKEGIKTTT
jgi:tetratricopeptide (TPR) repeat protein